MAKKQTKSDTPDVDKILKPMETKSAKIRYLTSEGWSRTEIAKKLGIRYQHVRNVQMTPLKKS